MQSVSSRVWSSDTGRWDLDSRTDTSVLTKFGEAAKSRYFTAKLLTKMIFYAYLAAGASALQLLIGVTEMARTSDLIVAFSKPPISSATSIKSLCHMQKDTRHLLHISPFLPTCSVAEQ